MCVRSAAAPGCGTEGPALADLPARNSEPPEAQQVPLTPVSASLAETTSLSSVWDVLVRLRRFVGLVLGGLAAVCLLYCLMAPNQYEAKARVALRTTPESLLGAESPAEIGSRLLATPDVQVETLANELRSEQLAWRVIAESKLYENAGFANHFARRFPEFRVDHASSAAQAYLLNRFERRLSVQAVPRSLILEIRFRSMDPALAAAVVNALIGDYVEQGREKRIEATQEQTAWLKTQLSELKSRVDAGDRRLSEFQKEHQLIDTPAGGADGHGGDTQHNAALLEIDELGKQLASATADRILREAEYRAAEKGNPELVLASDPGIEGQTAALSGGLLQQLHARHSDLEQESSQLRLEHGPNFPRAVEIRTEIGELDRQITQEDAKLLERFRDAWQTAGEREGMVRQSLEATTQEGIKLNEAALEYEVLRAEANANHELYLRLQQKAGEAGLEAGIENPDFTVVDPARQPDKPVSPDLPLYLGVALFVGFWLALAGAFTLDTIAVRKARALALVVLALSLALAGAAQAPTPSTSGLPTGVSRIPPPNEGGATTNAGEAPAIWGNALGTAPEASSAATGAGVPMPAVIAPGEIVEVREAHTPEFRTTARVDEAGEVDLPLVGAVRMQGLSEREAAHAIETLLVTRGMLLHPQVTVLVTAFLGQDVSVLGEVMRPGVYPFAVHHRLLDLISAASGLTPSAGSLVTIQHRDRARALQAFVLDRSASDSSGGPNPELEAGDTVQVQRAGLVYVVGDVLRPGGFPADPVQRLTVLQVLALAWGPTQNASLGKALLIREQAGGRTVTQLNLKRLMRGQDPDEQVMDRDILFVPNSATKNLLNRSVDSVVQSAAGVSIYAGMVYSQRF